MAEDLDFASCHCDFSGSYEVGQKQALREMEQYVLGCRYGATSWTTRAQAEDIVDELGLTNHSRVLDVGGGAGWPALYLASLTGGHITIVDPTELALDLAKKRAADDGLADRLEAVCASGDRLPFGRDSFDFLVHADVLCCTPFKAEILRECHRVARDGASMHFSVIRPAASLAAYDRERVLEHGPPYVDIDVSYQALLDDAHWTDVESTDVSGDYLDCMTKLTQYLRQNDNRMITALGQEEYDRVLAHRSNQLDLIESGYMLREVFVAQK